MAHNTHGHSTGDTGDPLFTLRMFLAKTKNVIPVFVAGLDTSCILRGKLIVLQRALPSLSDPRTLLALKKMEAPHPHLKTLLRRLDCLLINLDALIDKDVRNLSCQFRDLILRYNNDNDNKPATHTYESAIRGEESASGHPNIDALESILISRERLEVMDPSISDANSTLLSKTANYSTVIKRPDQDDEKRIMGSSEILQLSLTAIWPSLTGDATDLILKEYKVGDQVDNVEDNVEEIINRANAACARLKTFYQALSGALDKCVSSDKHVSKLLLSGLGGVNIGFVVSKCSTDHNEKETGAWYHVPCKIEQVPFLDCSDLQEPELLGQHVLLILGEDGQIWTESMEDMPRATFQSLNASESFISLQELLILVDSDSARITSYAGLSRFTGWATNWFSPRSQTTEHTGVGSALREHTSTIQYLLAESVFHLYSRPSLLDAWQPTSIEFPKTKMQPDFSKPFCLSNMLFADLNTPTQDQLGIDTYYRDAQAFMVRFGLLLLQIHFRKALHVVEGDRKDIKRFQALSVYAKDLRPEETIINNVIKHCMTFRRLLYGLKGGERLTEEDGKSNFRKVFYQYILKPLRADLQLKCPRIALEIQERSAWNPSFDYSHQGIPVLTSKGIKEHIKPSAIPPGVVPYSEQIGQTMVTRPSEVASTWFAKFEEMSEFLDFEDDSPEYTKDPVKVAVLDSGLSEFYQNKPNITYKSFIENPSTHGKDNSEHGTDSVALIQKAYSRVELYVAKVFDGNDADCNTATYMAKAIDWAMQNNVDIISISAGFKEDHAELERQVKKATAGGEMQEILIFAAASNWQDSQGGVAFPARMADRVTCIFCCNGGRRSSREWNPRARTGTSNFTMIGEDVVLDSGKKLKGGTSVSTALAAGLAAKIIDFSRQPDICDFISESTRRKLKTKAGMDSIFKGMSGEPDREGYECIEPWQILPADSKNKASHEKYRITMA
ncbi:unnamed protein product [Fusarium graminearum]|uniref:Peptidase S8/S53 domain-containing protein n=1 Tax=Gibberella zeae TaxID=5518 RepID=A0A9N8R772_GIBZA|nr:unnamed protein product [Fusarium graminearum]